MHFSIIGPQLYFDAIDMEKKTLGCGREDRKYTEETEKCCQARREGKKDVQAAGGGAVRKRSDKHRTKS